MGAGSDFRQVEPSRKPENPLAFLLLREVGEAEKVVVRSPVLVSTKILSALAAEEVKRLDWMDAVTQKRAMEKLSKMAYLVGYPSKWRSYEFAVEPKSWGKTGLAARAFDQSHRLGRIGKPVDRERWGMTPPTVNAYTQLLSSRRPMPGLRAPQRGWRARRS